MKIWIYLNGQQQGPFSIEELADKPIDRDTKVWFEGLDKWYPAGQLDELRPLFEGTEVEISQSPHDEQTDTEFSQAPHSEQENSTPRYAPGQRRRQPVLDEPCPPTFIGWSVALTICCCSPLSLAALIGSICVSTYYNKGDIVKSRKASTVTEWLVIIALALGIIPMTLMSLMF